MAGSIPACWRSRMNRRSISATMPSTVTRIDPVGSFVEKAGSSTVSAAAQSMTPIRSVPTAHNEVVLLFSSSRAHSACV